MKKIKNQVAIVIITYNNSSLLMPQVECIRKFCMDGHKIIVVDNSTDEETIEAIKYYCSKLKIELIKTSASSKGGSDSHSFAANVSYLMLRERYTHFFYADHDLFPVKPFSVIETLGANLFAGIGQAKEKTYLWPGCFMFNNKDIPDNLIDFRPSHALGLDTGGNLYKALEAYPDRTLFFDETYEENPEFNKSQYGFYAMINKGGFMHFINSSNWNPIEDHQERINSLLNILKKKAGI